MTEARMREYLAQLLRHQNPDGGFSAYRGGVSTMNDTAAALAALAARGPKQADPAKALAIGWLKQRLGNTWFDDKERSQRAAAFAALAVADAVDAASLHYFSDTGAASPLPAVAEAQIAAAFKHIREPNAAAFWIKKMIDENGRLKTIPVLDALAATDALSSDDVIAATSEMADALSHKAAPELKDAAALLRAISANNALAVKGRIATKTETHSITGVLALSANDAAAYRNTAAQPLYVTYISEENATPAASLPGNSVSRRIFRLNGVELAPPAVPARGEIYMIELKGEIPASAKNAPILVQNGGNGLRNVGCPLSPQLGTLPFIPWLVLHELTAFMDCEFSSHEMNVVLPPVPENEKFSFSLVSFAHIDAQAITEIPPPRLRFLPPIE
jgi:hypothetical protein